MSRRFDRVYLRTAEHVSVPSIQYVGLFGKDPTNSLGIVPSDHYGVFADLEVS